MADTYGNLNEKSTLYHIRRIERLGYKVGMHAHNNMGNALSKSLVAHQQPGVLMVDSCIGGLGRGAGNLWGELFFMELGKNFMPLLEVSDKFSDSRKTLLYALASHMNVHPDFVKDLLKFKKSTIKELVDLMKKIKIRCDKYNKQNYIPELVKVLYN